MNIIYITPLWSGMKSFFLEGNDKPSGMPAFYEVFIRVLERNDIKKVYVILFSDSDHFLVPSKYRNKIILIPYTIGYKFFMPIKYFKALRKVISLCKSEKIKFVYGHGPFSFIAGLSSFFCNVKAFQRVYGTFFINEINSSKIKLFIKYPFAYLSYYIRANGLIITNDGTHADIVFKKIGNKKTPFHFLINGIDKSPNLGPVSDDNPIEHDKYVVYIARIDKWKRQHLFVEIISRASERGFKIPGYIIGQVYDSNYHNEIRDLIKSKKLESQIKIIPGLPRSQANYILQEAVCTFSLYDTSNLGNVFLESLSLGVPMIAFNVNNSLDYIDKKCFISIDNEDVNLAVESLISLWQEEKMRQSISDEALKFAETSILSWEERSNLEIDILMVKEL